MWAIETYHDGDDDNGKPEEAPPSPSPSPKNRATITTLSAKCTHSILALCHLLRSSVSLLSTPHSLASARYGTCHQYRIDARSVRMRAETNTSVPPTPVYHRNKPGRKKSAGTHASAARRTRSLVAVYLVWLVYRVEVASDRHFSHLFNKPRGERVRHVRHFVYDSKAFSSQAVLLGEVRAPLSGAEELFDQTKPKPNKVRSN